MIVALNIEAEERYARYLLRRYGKKRAQAFIDNK